MSNEKEFERDLQSFFSSLEICQHVLRICRDKIMRKKPPEHYG